MQITKRLGKQIIAGVATLAWASIANGQTYTVIKGDTLAEIAKKRLGAAGMWPEICEANREKLGGNCERIVTGMQLTLPIKGGMAAGNAATTELTGDFVIEFDQAQESALRFPDGYVVKPTESGGPSHIEVSGHVDNAGPQGATQGVSVQVPDTIEQRASGKTVKVDLLVRTPNGEGEIAVAYSTAEVGNSGWQKLFVSEEFRVASFTYQVPELKVGNGDFIGIQPDPDNSGQTLEIAGLAVTVVE